MFNLATSHQLVLLSIAIAVTIFAIRTQRLPHKTNPLQIDRHLKKLLGLFLFQPG